MLGEGGVGGEEEEEYEAWDAGDDGEIKDDMVEKMVGGGTRELGRRDSALAPVEVSGGEVRAVTAGEAG